MTETKTKYLADFSTFRKDFFRTLLLIWNAGDKLSVLSICLLFLQAVLPVVSLYFVKVLVELMVKPGASGFDEIIHAILGFATAQFLSAVAGQISTYVNTIQQQKLTNYLSDKVLQKAVDVDLEYYENPDYHDTLHMAQQQSFYQAPLLINNVNGLLLNSLSLVLLIGFLFTLQWFYAVVFVALSVPLACIKWYYGYQLFRLEKKYVPLEREAGLYHQVLTWVNYAKEVRVFGLGSSFIPKYKHIRDTVFTEKKNINRKFTRYSVIAQAIEVVIMSIIFIALARNAWAGVISAGVFVIYLQGFQRLQSASKNFLQSLVQIFQQRLFLKDIFMFFDIESKTTAGNIPFPTLTKGLAAEHISFSYPHTGKQVLNDISITCPPGNIIAIVGENGSGKSTLVKLLARLYEVQAGSIRIENTDLSDISAESFRSNMTVMFQDFEKYFLSVEENIALADNRPAKEGTVEAAAIAAGAHGFISAFPGKYQTRLGRTFQKSEQLSGGQWQKLAVARAFYKNAQLLILDEPTSHIDAISEYELFENLKAQAKGKMVILISHRLYNLKMANTIYVMKNGAIAESGGFDELIGRNGLFTEMYNKQKL